jgi:hypothetical protein
LLSGVVVALLGCVLAASPIVATELRKYNSSPSRNVRGTSLVLGALAREDKNPADGVVLLRYYDEAHENVGGCSAGIQRVEVGEDKSVYALLTVGHCIEGMIDGVVNSVDMFFGDGKQVLNMESVGCIEYKHEESKQDNPSICIFQSNKNVGSVFDVTPLVTAPYVDLSVGQSLSAVGYPAVTNSSSLYDASLYAAEGVVTSKGDISTDYGVTQEVACTSIFGYGGMSGGAVFDITGRVVGVVASTCAGPDRDYFSNVSVNLGVRDLPSDFDDFAEECWRILVND